MRNRRNEKAYIRPVILWATESEICASKEQAGKRVAQRPLLSSTSLSATHGHLVDARAHSGIACGDAVPFQRHRASCLICWHFLHIKGW
jgi:hypothetical protein